MYRYFANRKTIEKLSSGQIDNVNTSRSFSERSSIRIEENTFIPDDLITEIPESVFEDAFKPVPPPIDMPLVLVHLRTSRVHSK